MSKITEKRFNTRTEVIAELLKDTVDILSNATRNYPQASMLLSGGTSPGEFYKALSNEDLNWGKIWFGLSDERWVDADHTDSNEKLIHDTLLQNKAKDAHFVGIKTSADITTNNGSDAQKSASEQLQKLPNPYDIVLLGMGIDGHAASLFPDSKNTPDALDTSKPFICAPIFRGEGETPRMSMTVKALLNAMEVKLLFFGEEKWNVYEEAKKQVTNTLPVSHILNQGEATVTVYWAP